MSRISTFSFLQTPKTTKRKSDTTPRKPKKKDDVDLFRMKMRNIRQWYDVIEKKYDDIEKLDEMITASFLDLVRTRENDPKVYADVEKTIKDLKKEEDVIIGDNVNSKFKNSTFLANSLKRIVDLEIDASEILYNYVSNSGSSLGILEISTLRSNTDDDTIFKNKKHLDRDEKPISETSYTTVFKGKLEGMDVCIKEFSPSETGLSDLEFFDLVNKMKNISHPALITYFSLTTEPRQIVLQFAQKFSLEDILNLKPNQNKEKIKLSFFKKMKISKETAIGLQWIYSNNFKHLRLKPSNLLFTSDMELKLADYGWGLLPLEKPEELINSGHAYYYAPELLNLTQKEGDESSDIYSFGLIVETLLTEKIPFSQTKNFEELKTEKGKKRELPPATPRALKNFIYACTGPKESRPTFRKINEEEISNDEEEGVSNAEKAEVSSSDGKKHKIWDKIILEVMCLLE